MELRPWLDDVATTSSIDLRPHLSQAQDARTRKTQEAVCPALGTLLRIVSNQISDLAR